jgi:hypothetical protein
LASPACGESCTLLYAADAVRVVFDGTLADGPWVIALEDAACELEVPTGVAACDAGLTLEVDEGGQPLEALRLEWAPRRFELSLAHQGEVRYQQVVQPVYTLSEPNGPGCGETKAGFVQVRL